MATREPVPSGKVDSTFITALNAANRGVLVDELSEEFRGLVRQVQETGKPGTMDLKLKIDHGGQGRVLLTVNTKLAPPKADAEATVLYADEDGNVTRRKTRPGQTRLLLESSEDDDDE